MHNGHSNSRDMYMPVIFLMLGYHGYIGNPQPDDKQDQVGINIALTVQFLTLIRSILHFVMHILWCWFKLLLIKLGNRAMPYINPSCGDKESGSKCKLIHVGFTYM